ncbi:uncharacterized protein DUF3304 [Enterobacter sp. BIGb0383]|uniref:DUF3304 domain-containing protein n=1 Tax=unclassified Enterobacter TaxID=2608935 RepID=UPI000F49DCE4|nr:MULTISPECIES: DUF3304 domain-containing protein [unclassified Enterobacter]ROP61543.1 uncharacterized protein DUF3304 [Enterobacter sp. BIGb0383]ROS11704.1 uncharacterized protein DUF3304 [Enterobacter sp. BIGb0359]
MDLIKITLFKRLSVLLLFGPLLLVGCDEPEKWSGGDLRGVNHTANGINYFEVNYSRGPNIGAFGEGGGSCCISLPNKWRPGLQARVEWEIDPNPYEELPRIKNGFGFEKEAYARHAANYQKHNMTIDIPDYGDEKCGLTVHFLPCNQIKATASCWTYGAAKYPIKEPHKMEEPAVCP